MKAKRQAILDVVEERVRRLTTAAETMQDETEARAIRAELHTLQLARSDVLVAEGEALSRLAERFAPGAENAETPDRGLIGQVGGPGAGEGADAAEALGHRSPNPPSGDATRKLRASEARGDKDPRNPNSARGGGSPR